VPLYITSKQGIIWIRLYKYYKSKWNRVRENKRKIKILKLMVNNLNYILKYNLTYNYLIFFNLMNYHKVLF